MSVPGLKVCTSSLTSSEVNVAYDGTFGDLSSAGDANMFNTNMSDTFEFDLKQLLAEAANNRQSSTFTPFEDGSRETGATVSPKDVFNNDSVPPSTSFTNLTTPGSTYLETPEEEFQTSPLFSDNLGYGGGNQGGQSSGGGDFSRDMDDEIPF